MYSTSPPTSRAPLSAALRSCDVFQFLRGLAFKMSVLNVSSTIVFGPFLAHDMCLVDAGLPLTQTKAPYQPMVRLEPSARDSKVAVAFLKYKTMVLSSFSSYMPRKAG